MRRSRARVQVRVGVGSAAGWWAMSEAGVSPGAGRSPVPFRARAAYVGYEMFGSGDGAVVVETEVARDLRQAAELHAPHETGGLLYGQVWRDGEGRYVLVDGFAQAGPDAGKTGEFNLSPMGTQLLRETAARTFPAADEVGWWHTHRAPSPYSQTDFTMQRAFQRPDSVGLLVFASGAPWATAYLGPEGRALGQPGMLPPATVPGRSALAAAGAHGIAPLWNPFRRPRWARRRRTAESQAGRADQPQGNPLRGYRLRGAADPGDSTAGTTTAWLGAGPGWEPAAGTGPRSAAAPPDPRARPSATLPVTPQPSGTPPVPQPSGTRPVTPRPTRSPDTLWQPQRLEREPHDAVHHSVGARAVLWLAVCAGLGAVVAIIVLAVTVVSSIVHAVDNAANAPSLEWSCHHNGIAPGIYACVATVSLPPGSKVWWLADGKAYHEGLLMTITVHRKEKVEAVLITPSGKQYSKGTRTLEP